MVLPVAGSVSRNSARISADLRSLLTSRPIWPERATLRRTLSSSAVVPEKRPGTTTSPRKPASVTSV
ncbi:hypothetical protein D9M72_302630 [compost metagenome]